MEVESGAVETETETAASNEVEINDDAFNKHLNSRKFKIKDKDFEEELGFEELKRRAQKSSAADRRFNDASKRQKEMSQVVEALKAGDFKHLQTLVGKEEARKLAENLILSDIEYEQMSDDQRENYHQKAELDDYKRKAEDSEKADKLRRQGQLRQAAVLEVDTEINKVLEGINSKPTPRLIARIAEQMLSHLQKTGGKLAADEAYKRANKGYQSDAIELLENLSADEVLNFLPKEVLAKIRNADVKQAVKKSPFGNRKALKKSGERRSRGNPKAMSTDDAFKKLGNRFS